MPHVPIVMDDVRACKLRMREWSCGRRPVIESDRGSVVLSTARFDESLLLSGSFHRDSAQRQGTSYEGFLMDR
jgi:hypothetical protein